MKRRWLTLLALAAVVVALGLALQFRPRSDHNKEYALSALKPAAATAIRVARDGRADLVLEKSLAGWRMSAPFAARADELQVLRLLGVLEAKARTRFPATDLARFELAPPAVRLTINGENFGLGGVNPVTREQYVLVRDTVYSVEVRFLQGIPSGPSAIVHKRLFDSEDRLVRFELPGLRVTQEAGKWVVAPAPADVSQDDVLRWVEQWRQTAALRVEPAGGQKPREEIRVTRADGRVLTLGIVQREPEMLLIRSDDGLQYALFAEVGNRLLTAPGTRQKPGPQP